MTSGLDLWASQCTVVDAVLLHMCLLTMTLPGTTVFCCCTCAVEQNQPTREFVFGRRGGQWVINGKRIRPFIPPPKTCSVVCCQLASTLTRDKLLVHA
mgnify:CR=1 FL=1